MTGGYPPHLPSRWPAWIHSGDHGMAPRAIGATGEIVARVQDGDDERRSDKGVQWIAIPVALTDTSGAMSREVGGLVGREERTAILFAAGEISNHVISVNPRLGGRPSVWPQSLVVHSFTYNSTASILPWTFWTSIF